MSGLRTLLGVAVRRDRLRLGIWLVAIAGVLAGSAASTAKLYPTHAELAELAKGLADTPATLAFYGPAAQLDTVGGLAMWKPGGILLVLTGLMTILTVVRHTRAEEEAGRAELVGAGAVGRLASLVAALLLAAGASALLGVLVALGLAGTQAGGVGAVGAGLSFTATGFVFTAVAAVAAQVCITGRAASGLAGAVLAASYVLRAVADGEPRLSWLAWLSPIGWVQRLEPYADGPRWWVLVLPLALAVVLALGAAWLQARRDLGTALLAGRPGPAAAGAVLAGPMGLVWRLQRISLLSWVVACAGFGALAGWLAAVACVLVGIRPAWVGLAWVVLAAAVVLGLLGEVLGLPSWLQDLSPYAHLPHLPAAVVPGSALVAPLVITGLAVVLTALGAAAYRRRDIPT